MGNSCSRIDPCVASQLREPTCRNQQCTNMLPLIDEESADDYPASCQLSTYLLNRKDNIASPNGGYETLGAVNSLINPGLQMLQPSLIGPLNHKAASSPLAITDGNAMLHTHAENGRSQTDASTLKKPCAAQLQFYIVTWNMNGRVSIKYHFEIMLMICPNTKFGIDHHVSAPHPRYNLQI